MTDPRSPFLWQHDPRPSIFARDTAFCGYGKTGKTHSQTASEASDKFQARTGRSAGSIKGLSAKADVAIEQAEHTRRARRG